MRTKKFWERRFHSVESGANNVLFIRTSLPHPEALVEHIVAATAAGGGQSARFILRLVPILGTCKAVLGIR
jgi:tRNA acetyltransferase TAN1